MGDGDRPSQISTKLIALQDRSCFGKVVGCVEFVVAEEFEDTTMQAIRAGLGGCVEKSSAAVVLGRVWTLLNAELLQRIDGSLNERPTLVLFAYVHAVEQKRN